MDDNQVYQLFLSNKTTPNDAPVNMTGIPPDYHEFTDVFSKPCASAPTLHQPYNLKIELEEATSSSIWSDIFPFPEWAEISLRVLDGHLAMDFICPSCSPGGAPVLFVCKKGGSLHLCVNLYGLNKIMKKDHYPLPHISDFLNSLCKARFYTKIDLCHVYHLVHIHKGNEGKTAFHTHLSELIL